MREIKFRAWDTDSGVMRYDGFALVVSNSEATFHFVDYPDGDNPMPGSNEICSEMKRLWDNDSPAVMDMSEWSFETKILMQYTGLKDKNGKEIYDGDILSGSFCGSPGNRVVTYQPRTMQFVFIDPHGLVGAYDDLEWTSPHRIEVIGNIYETPELLEGK